MRPWGNLIAVSPESMACSSPYAWGFIRDSWWWGRWGAGAGTNSWRWATPPNLAARLQGIAAPNTLVLRASTSLARLWQPHGKRADAQALLAPIYAQEARALLEELR